MNWSLLVPLLVTTVVAMFGWIVEHRWAAKRDRASKRREQRVQYLIDAYRCFAKASHHPQLHEIASDVKCAVADIHLFGNDKQIQLVQKFVSEMVDKNTAPLDDLLNSLRKDLRHEIDLHPVESDIHWLRIPPP